MPTTEQLRAKLVKKLNELFQLSKPDLDFGFYRIMHAKAREVNQFITEDLLKIVEEAFGNSDEARAAELRDAYETAIRTATEFGAPNPEDTEPVKKAKAAIEAHKDTTAKEADVYDHLYRFFERYYDDGDFISRRYYARETAGTAAPFAIPYNGEEVKLHWANADQYYIKSTEYFSNFTFDAARAREIRKLSEEERTLKQIPDEPTKVHFRVVEATEGEHGNVKAAEASKRYFLIHQPAPVEFNDAGELVVNFEYRPDPEKTGQDATWRDSLNEKTIERVISELERLEKTDRSAGRYLRVLTFPAPTEKQKDRPLLAKYVNQYTARNTMDYFIHKDLGGFLRRELDFYIKNEVMQLDDIENADAPSVESYLSKIKVLRRIAGKLIDFLAQLENFQKKLWLKKKFVVETNYCITLDRIPEDLYPEIAANKAQTDEWIKLFAIDAIEGDLHNPGFARPLSAEFLKANDKLVLDTRFFSEEFKARLIASIDDFDEQCDGLLIHSENFQALLLGANALNEDVDLVYIDPPYNSDASSIIYKNDYKSSSWMSLIYDRLEVAQSLLVSYGICALAIDDEQVCEARSILRKIFSKELGISVVRSNPQSRKAKGKFSPVHEYCLFFGKSIASTPGSLDATTKKLKRYPLEDLGGHFAWMNFIRSGSNDKRSDRPRLFYPIYVNVDNGLRIPKMEWSESENAYHVLEAPNENETVVFPIAESEAGKIEKNWHRGHTRVVQDLSEYRVRRDSNGKISIDFKTRIDINAMPTTWWDKNEYASANYGAAELKALFGLKEFNFPKASMLVTDCLIASNSAGSKSFRVLDFFAGSGTTGHAVINLNREDGGKRKYILVEMGDYFDTVLKPRIAKVVYSDFWKDGKPMARHSGISHCFKYLRLESYEDTLNNLRFDEDPERVALIESTPTLREDYMLHYLLDVETRGSRSLLDIDAFADPRAYTLEVKKPGTDEYVTRTVDLVETFNYLIGLRVGHYEAPREFTARFKRDVDPEIPDDQQTKLIVDGDISELQNTMDSKFQTAYWFRCVTGWIPKDRLKPDNGERLQILVIWRTLSNDIEKDNLMLDEMYLSRFGDHRFDKIFVNGSNNLANLAPENESWNVGLIEEEFMKRMWDAEEI